MATEVDLAYFAGLFDGEGSISIAKVKCTRIRNPSVSFYYRLQVCLVNNDRPVVEWLKSQFGGSICVRNMKGARMETHCWSCCCQQGLRFLQQVFPYLHIKRRQAEVAIKFQLGKRSPKGIVQLGKKQIAEQQKARDDIMRMNGHKKDATIKVPVARIEIKAK